MKSYRKRKAEICSVRKDKAGGRVRAGQVGKKSIDWQGIVRLVRKNAWREFDGEAD